MSSKWKSTKNHWTKIKTGKEREEIIKKVSKGWFGGPNNKFKIGIKNRVKCKCLLCGKIFEVKKSKIKYGRGKYCSDACKYKAFGLKERGDKHWNWRGGITTENDKVRKSISIRLWRESVFARDNYTCQKCGKKTGEDLNSHHIKNFADNPELRTFISNGITFCKKCHMKFHKIYKKRNNTKEQLKEFLT